MNRTEAIRKLRPFADALKARGATSLYLFGSAARNEAGSKSDLDLFLDYDPKGKFNALGAASDASKKGRGRGHPGLLMQARSSLLRIHDMLEAIRGIEQAAACPR
jgi:hypothetical protein